MPENNNKCQENTVPVKTLLNLLQKKICKLKCGEKDGIGFFVI